VNETCVFVVQELSIFRSSQFCSLLNYRVWCGEQGSLVKMIDLDGYLEGTTDFFHDLSDHKARITCM